jgi:hypothetical protein
MGDATAAQRRDIDNLDTHRWVLSSIGQVRLSSALFTPMCLWCAMLDQHDT